ncbi:hypothetical protein [Candidiatus Paracoxiella cheracis]|uniref:hypothetical protein n=1 Tax=Candidiatus Paracoxiella cheracis TaxID=3405120 RepID=UPI003BF5A0E4
MDGLTQLSENELKNEIQKIKEKMEKKDSKKGSLKTQSTIDSYASIIELFRKLVGIID